MDLNNKNNENKVSEETNVPVFAPVDENKDESAQAFAPIASDDVEEKKTSDATPVFATISEPKEEKEQKTSISAFTATQEDSKAKNEDNNEDKPSAFALGLPDWDVVPPQIMVRRRN